MAKRHMASAEIVVLTSDSASSEGDSNEHIQDRYHEESSDVFSDAESDPLHKKSKHGTTVKLQNHVEDMNANLSHVSQKTFRDDACDDGQSEPLFNWTVPNVTQPVLPPFTATWGCRVHADGVLPINYFQLFLDDEFFENCVQKINCYAEQYFLEQEKEKDGGLESSQWTPTDLSEVQTFWGLTLNLGIVQMPSFESFWSENPIYNTPIFMETMCHHRFLLLQKFLHYNDNTLALPPDHPEFDHLFKVRPFLDHLLKRFQEVYIPGQNLVVDGSLPSYKGRRVCREYFTEDEIFWKLHRLCESSTGYTYRFRVCINEVSDLVWSECFLDFGIVEEIVDDLVNPLYNQGYHLYMNQTYSNPALFRLLYTKGTLACGTIHRSNKGFPQELKVKKQKKGETTVLRCEELLAVKYKGSKDQCLLTTIHDESTLEVEENVTQPKCLLDHNYYMSEVERSGERLESFIGDFKDMVWYEKLVLYLVQLSMFNAYVVYRQKTTAEERLSFRKFQESIIRSLLGMEAEERLVGRHFPYPIPQTTNARPAGRCRVCARHGLHKDTCFYCPHCSLKPALCIGTCFEDYHTKETY
ncbi:piggyBac transposable element-derived protein 4-like [Rana temporaria]|uniref:piggyBac transposable element-derived protein 4-like n=1 Tax=Rana temporaria TaxID=8407 RepID=UPI001AADE923|nr:piggyBac transposable element-derived protein 4-like [Rana temporaria]